MTSLLRPGAVSGVLSGLLIAVPGAIEAFTGETAATSFALALSPALALPLLTGLYLGQAHAAGRLGTVGYLVNLVGLGLFGGAAFMLNMALYYLDEPVATELLKGPTRVGLLGGAVVFVVGTVLFGVSMVRARVLPPAPAWAYAIALTVFALLAPVPDSPLTSVVHVAVGLILVWLSAALWRLDRGIPAGS